MNWFGGLIGTVALVLLAMFVGERYGWLQPERSSQSTNILATRCAVPVSGTDAKGEWWGINGIKYRMSSPPSSPTDQLCGDGKIAYWQSSR